MSTLAVEIELPDDLTDGPGIAPALRDQVARHARAATLVMLYDQGQVSTGRAATVLGMSRDEFLQVLGRYGVSEFDDALDVDAEAHLAYTRSSLAGHQGHPNL